MYTGYENEPSSVPPSEPWTAPPPAPNNHAGRNLLIVFAVIAGLLVAAGVGAAITTNGKSTPAAIVTGGVVSPGTQPKSTNPVGVYTALEAVHSDMTNLSTVASEAASSGDTSSLTAACTATLPDLDRLDAVTPSITNNDAQSALTSSTAEVRLAMTDCQIGDYTGMSSALTLAQTFLQTATADLGG